MRRGMILLVVLSAIGAITGWQFLHLRNVSAAPGVALPTVFQALPGGGNMTAVAVGHEYREDDLPSIARAPDGSLWVAWLSFVGNLQPGNRGQPSQPYFHHDLDL